MAELGKKYFSNGYGVSVIEVKQGGWEVAVTKGTTGWLCYTTPFTDDVVRFTQWTDVLAFCDAVEDWFPGEDPFATHVWWPGKVANTSLIMDGELTAEDQWELEWEEYYARPRTTGTTGTTTDDNLVIGKQRVTNVTSTADRCPSVTTLKRADELSLGDQIILSMWDDRWEIRTVTQLTLLNDSVEIRYAPKDGEILTKIGVGFHVVTLNERFK